MEALRFFQFDGVERDRLRERERQARAQMSSQVADQESPGTSGSFLFREPIRVNPSSADPVTQQIQSKLGDFQRVRHFLDQKDSGLIGVDGVPPSPGGPPPSRHHMPLPPGQLAGGAPSRLQPSPESRTEFKKPHHHLHHPHQRGGYVKPAEGKPPYNGRGGYPGQPVKHGSGTTSHRSNGILPAKGPPLSSPTSLSSLPTSSSSGRFLPIDRNPRNLYEQNQGPTAGPRETLPSATPVADVDNIFKEMIVPTTPLTAMAATPRIELDNKYTYNPLLAKHKEVPDEMEGKGLRIVKNDNAIKESSASRQSTGSSSRSSAATSTGKTPRSRKRSLKDSEGVLETNRPKENPSRYDRLARNWTEKLKALQDDQRIMAEKLIDDVLLKAEFGRLDVSSLIAKPNVFENELRAVQDVTTLHQP